MGVPNNCSAQKWINNPKLKFVFLCYLKTLKENVRHLLHNRAVQLTSLLHVVQNERGTSLIYSFFNLFWRLQWLTVELMIYIVDTTERCVSELRQKPGFLRIWVSSYCVYTSLGIIIPDQQNTSGSAYLWACRQTNWLNWDYIQA